MQLKRNLLKEVCERNFFIVKIMRELYFSQFSHTSLFYYRGEIYFLYIKKILSIDIAYDRFVDMFAKLYSRCEFVEIENF